MRKLFLQKTIAFLLIVILSAALFGCAAEDRVKAGDSRIVPETAGADKKTPVYAVSGEMTGGTSAAGIEAEPMDETLADAYNEYAFRFFREVLAEEAGTMMVSPYSLWFALGMLSNGATDTTLAEIEQVTGMSTEQMNRLAAWFMSRQEDDGVFTIADSVWFTGKFAEEIYPEYLHSLRWRKWLTILCPTCTMPLLIAVLCVNSIMI